MTNPSAGSDRLFDTLIRVLDSLRNEAPTALSIYHPPPGNGDAIIQARSRALLHLFLKARFGLVDFKERETFVTDGKFDGGIDAFYIDRKAKFIYVLQSKFRATSRNFISSNMTADDLLKMDVQRILKGDKKDEQGNEYNEQIRKSLQKAIQQLPDAASYTRQVVLLGNSKRFSPSQLKKLVEGYEVDQFPHERIYKELLYPVVNGTYFTDPNLTIEIRLENLKGDTHLDYGVKAHSLRANIKLLFVPTIEMGRIMSTYRNSILKFNPRSFLELEGNPVNQQIEASIRSETSNEFALFNNGITIVSDGTSVSSDTAKPGTAQVVVRNPQLINGGQTAYTLGRIYQGCSNASDFKVFKGKEVLLKIITFVAPQTQSSIIPRQELVSEISKASNAQTVVKELDRRSNDLIQIRLQELFFERHGLYYERKLGEFSDGLLAGYIKPEHLVNRERILRISLAADFKVNQARSSLNKFFGKDELAGQLDVNNAEKYVVGYEAMLLLEATLKDKNKPKGDRYRTATYGQALRYGNYAVIAICVNQAMKAGKTPEEAVKLVLAQWKDFEAWVSKEKSNSAYGASGSFDFTNYYKGATINADLQAYPFSF